MGDRVCKRCSNQPPEPFCRECGRGAPGHPDMVLKCMEVIHAPPAPPMTLKTWGPAATTPTEDDTNV